MESHKNDHRALLQQALVTLEQMEGKLRSIEQAQHEPIAITGMGIRFPGGADDAASFWNLLYNGIDAITEVPPDRWNVDQFYDPDPDAIGKMYSRWGGFLKEVDKFDPQFFGISPREATSMDPQQRLLLETAWEALENAGAASSKLAGSRTGVFIGMVGSDYTNLQMISGGIHDMDAYFATGVARSIAAGRIAYTWGLHGPAVAVDTACSSSLVAAHQACRSLRSKECDMAIAGGVNLILDPSGSISTSRGRMMSVDGRCKTFDAAADGYVRAEGCAMVVLKRLSDAQANGDRILAVILGSAVNQDGRSNGLTAPNGRAQEEVMRAALADARLNPADVSYVETHGTGTSLGDPIEVRALGSVFNEGHGSDNPLMIGSVKTNVGHLEAAAGIVGLVKVVLALQNKTIPPHIHLNKPNPLIPWNDLPITVPTKPTPWMAPDGKPLVAGLSSFGFSGTNSHFIIAEAPASGTQEPEFERAAQLLTLSAKTETALEELADRHSAYFLENPSAPLGDVAYSLNTGRSHFTHRLALTANSLEQAQQKLSAWITDRTSPGVTTGQTDEAGRPEVVFLFTGQGSQYAGMARQLYESHPTFKSLLDRCDTLLRPHLDRPLLSVLYPTRPEDETLIHQTAYTQPALFAVEYGLAKLWQSWGLEPSVVMGHSVGEYVAACVAGIFSLEDGLKLIAERGRMMQSLPSGGVMMSIAADEKRVRSAIAPHGREVSIAAVNGPGSVVISGAESSVGLVVDALQKDGIKSQPLTVSHAFHSPLMNPILDDFERVAASIQYHPPQIGIVSNVSGRLIVDDGISNAAYWRDQIRQTVRFEDGVRALFKEGYRFFVEIGPSPTLLGLARRCEPVNPDSLWLPSLRSSRGDWDQMLESLGRLYIHGLDVDWDAYERDYKSQRNRLSLPAYPFQRERYWLDLSRNRTVPETKTGHPLLGSRLPTATPVFHHSLSAANPAYLADHVIHDTIILPASAYVEIALAAAKHAMDEQNYVLENVSIRDSLPLSEEERITQILVTNDSNGASFQFFSRAMDHGPHEWVLHADGRLRPLQSVDLSNAPVPEELRARLSHPMHVEAYYEHLTALGAEYGPAFRGIEEVWRVDGEAFGRIKLPESLLDDAGRYSIHPALLDACFQLIGTAAPVADHPEGGPKNRIFVPVGIGQVRVLGEVGNVVDCHVKIHPSEVPASRMLIGDLHIFDETGKVVVIIDGLRLQQISHESLQRAVQNSTSQNNPGSLLYEVDWIEQSVNSISEEQSGPGSWLIFAGNNPACDQLVRQLESKGEECRLVFAGENHARRDSRHMQINPAAPEEYKQMLAEATAGFKYPFRGVVHFWSLDQTISDQTSLETARSAMEHVNGSVLFLVQAMAGLTDQSPRLWLITQGAQAVDESAMVDPVSASLWGLGNVIASENPALNCVRIDLDPAGAEVPELIEEVRKSFLEDQIAFRSGKRFAARLVHTAGPGRSTAEDESLALRIKERGVLDNLILQPAPRRAPGPGEVEIEVSATGLNFRDVLNVLGMYPGEAGPLGSECAGRVAAVGAGVDEFKIGDPVMALAMDSFGRYVTVQAVLAVHKPDHISFTEAAGIPIAFLTANYALDRLAKMKAGDRVLIHAAAGGVGMAAVQLARRAGAEIFGTAGSDEKRNLLKTMGVHHVMNSRTLDFHDEIMELTGGKGVDIVLNSLSGDFIPKSISVLTDGGRFIEIGKTGVWDEERVKEMKSGLSYFVLYLGEVLEKDPLLIRQMLLDLLADFKSKKLKPLPLHIFPIEKSVDAFRFMAQAKHTGKIVIIQKPPGSQAAIRREDATYLITGGLGGLGLVTARWLADRGARHLVLAGRNPPAEEAVRAVDELTIRGVKVHVAQTDVSQPDQMETLFGHIQENMPPLRGIIHAAGVLDDGILREQSWSRFQTVLAPKVDGAWNLHLLTKDMPLDFFILFSAGASLLGSPGQGNYASANAFLDGLAHYRRRSGLPALSINWGPWAEVGMVSRLGNQNQRRWAVQGMGSIKPAEGMRALELLLERQTVQAGVLLMDWNKAAREEAADVRPLLRLLVQSDSNSSGTGRTGGYPSFLDQLKQTPPEEQIKFLRGYLTLEINKVLGLEASHTLNPRQGFTDIGLDSLMAVELSNRLQKTLDRRLPSTLTFEYSNIESLTNFLATEVLAISTAAVSAETVSPADRQREAINAEVESIPDEKLEDALLDELKNAGY